MRSKIHFFSLCSCLVMLISAVGCNGTLTRAGGSPHYPVPQIEAQWIQDGEPLMFEGEAWYPKDDVDVLLDDEVYLLGEYRGVQFFVEKVDIRPYHRLRTKFAANRFRAYSKEHHD